MPIYDLKCDACGHTFEKFVTHLIQESDKECPRCYSNNVSQKFNGGSFAVGGNAAAGGCAAPSHSKFG